MKTRMFYAADQRDLLDEAVVRDKHFVVPMHREMCIDNFIIAG
jgi:hypothetical protein